MLFGVASALVAYTITIRIYYSIFDYPKHSRRLVLKAMFCPLRTSEKWRFVFFFKPIFSCFFFLATDPRKRIENSCRHKIWDHHLPKVTTLSYTSSYIRKNVIDYDFYYFAFHYTFCLVSVFCCSNGRPVSTRKIPRVHSAHIGSAR